MCVFEVGETRERRVEETTGGGKEVGWREGVIVVVVETKSLLQP